MPGALRYSHRLFSLGIPMKRLSLLLAIALAPALRAELKLPAIFSDHMVLQQKQTNPVWGWDTPGTKVSVTFAGQTRSAEAGADGSWRVKLDPVPANATPQTIVIAGSSKREIADVLVGEVWMCSGQSNMGFQLQSDWNGDLEAAASDLPNLRLLCPGHGPVIENPVDYIDAYINGRHARDRQILAALAETPEMTTWAIMELIYADLNLGPRLRRAADRQVATHLRKLEKEGRVKVYAGRPRQKSAEELAQAEDEEHERLDVIRRADEYREEARRRSLIGQENPWMQDWAEQPRYALA